MTRSFRALGILALCGAGLAACGETDVERAATGAVIGGAVAAATGENIGNAALIGGAIGAVSCNVAPGAPNCY
jgi:osmotically inducible lipoprotein OsmB